MIREVDLVSYLPPFLAEYKENTLALEAENPEFVLVWEAADRVLYNEFIAMADEYGISRFEKILNILPSKEDTLESRRARIQNRWFNVLPYTLKVLIEKMILIFGESNFSIKKNYQEYQLEIITNFEQFGQVEELKQIIDTMIPCNIVVKSFNEIYCNSTGTAFVAAGACTIEHFFITNDGNKKIVVEGSALTGGGIVNAVNIKIMDTVNERK